MAKKLGAIFILILLIGGAGAYWRLVGSKNSEVQTDEAVVNPADDLDTDSDQSNEADEGHSKSQNHPNTQLAQQPGLATGTESENDQGRVGKLSLPDLERIKREITENPSSTPESLLRFSKDLGVELEAALEDRNHAQKLMRFLERCTTSTVGSEVLLPIAATCLSHAREVADEYGDDFEKKFNEIYSKSDPQVKQVFDAIEEENFQEPDELIDED